MFDWLREGATTAQLSAAKRHGPRRAPSRVQAESVSTVGAVSTTLRKTLSPVLLQMTRSVTYCGFGHEQVSDLLSARGGLGSPIDGSSLHACPSAAWSPP